MSEVSPVYGSMGAGVTSPHLRRATRSVKLPPARPDDEVVQLALPGLTDGIPNAQAFEAWRATPGGRWILGQCCKRAAYFARIYRQTGQRVSVRLLWELVRYFDLNKIRALVGVKRVDGYAMNDHFHAHVARYIYHTHPSWDGMFEVRAINRARRATVTTITRVKYE